MAISLQQAVKLALNHSHEYKIALLKEEQSRLGFVVAWGAFLPAADFTMSATKKGPFKSSSQNSHATAIQLNQNIYNQPLMDKIKAARLVVALSEKQASQVRSSLIQDVCTQYGALVLALSSLDSKKASKNELVKQYEEVKVKHKAGLANKGQLLLVETQLNRVNTEIESSRVNVMLSQSRLELLLGTSVNRIQLFKKGELNLWLNNSESEQWQSKAMDHNLEIHIAKLQQLQADNEYRVSISNRLPVLSGKLIYQNNSQARESGLVSANQFNLSATIQLSAQLNATTVAMPYLQKKAAQMAERHFQQTQESVMSQIDMTLNSIQDFQLRVKSERKAFILSRESIDLSKSSYRQGVVTALEVLKTISDSLDVNLTLEKAKLDLLLNHVKLQSLTGGLDEVYIDKLSSYFESSHTAL